MLGPAEVVLCSFNSLDDILGPSQNRLVSRRLPDGLHLFVSHGLIVILRRFKLTYANVMATGAMFVALGGVGYAATSLPVNSVGTTQLKDRAVTSSKIATATLTSLKGTTGPRGLTGQQGPRGYRGTDGTNGVRGETGLQGNTGDKGDTGTQGAPAVISTATIVRTSENPDPIIESHSDDLVVSALAVGNKETWPGSTNLELSRSVEGCLISIEQAKDTQSAWRDNDYTSHFLPASVERIDGDTLGIHTHLEMGVGNGLYEYPLVTFTIFVACPVT